MVSGQFPLWRQWRWLGLNSEWSGMDMGGSTAGIGQQERMVQIVEDRFIQLFHRHVVDLPAFQFVQVTGEKAGYKTREANGFQFSPYLYLHILNCNVAYGEMATLVAMAAVHDVPATIGVGASTVFIPLHRHSAGLTVFIHSFHSS